MKLSYKLILGFLVGALLVSVIGNLGIQYSKDTLVKSIGESSVPIAQESMNKIDSTIYNRNENIQDYTRDTLLAEIFVTNKYGANAGQAEKTTDYYQADEKWWQETKNNGLHVSDVAFDKSADNYAIDIGVSLDDEQGSFAGVIKAVLKY